MDTLHTVAQCLQSLLDPSLLVHELLLLLPPPHLQQYLVPPEGLGVGVQPQHDVEVFQWILLLGKPLWPRPES